MSARIAGISLVGAALLFWLSWLLMPGVGVTDAEQIFELVGSQRLSVAVSVVVQLLSAVLYVPALLGIASHAHLGSHPGVRVGAGVLLVGAMGSAADAVLHLLAYAMTAPGVEAPSLIRVMAFMQGPGLLFLAPLLGCFFVGGAWLSVAFARACFISRGGAYLHGAAVVLAMGGGAAASLGLVSPRAVGLAVLGCVGGAQVWVGLALSSPGAVRAAA